MRTAVLASFAVAVTETSQAQSVSVHIFDNNFYACSDDGAVALGRPGASDLAADLGVWIDDGTPTGTIRKPPAGVGLEDRYIVESQYGRARLSAESPHRVLFTVRVLSPETPERYESWFWDLATDSVKKIADDLRVGCCSANGDVAYGSDFTAGRIYRMDWRGSYYSVTELIVESPTLEYPSLTCCSRDGSVAYGAAHSQLASESIGIQHETSDGIVVCASNAGAFALDIRVCSADGRYAFGLAGHDFVVMDRTTSRTALTTMPYDQVVPTTASANGENLAGNFSLTTNQGHALPCTL